MAANDYYNSHPHRQELNAPLPPLPLGSQSSSGPTNILTPSSSNSSPHGEQSSPYHSHQGSQHSFGGDNGYYGSNGNNHSQDPFADNIPLRPHPQKYSSDYAGDQSGNTPPDEQLPGPGGNGGKRKRRKDRLPPVKSRIPWFVYVVTTIQVAVFIGEIIKNSILTKSPIAIHPSFNPMIGPSPYVLINMGARFVPCMRSTPGVQDSTVAINWPCPNTTTSDPNDPSMKCQLSDLCNFNPKLNPQVGGSLTANPQPNQWWRFIVPMFLHAGIIHISFNMLLQMTLGRDMEKSIGPLRFALVYLSSGIFGFILGGNFAPDGIASTGASGALFGILALVLLDIFYTWGERKSPLKDLGFIAVDIIISFVLGLLPGLDNFSHIGGFLMGLALGLCLLHSPNALRRRIGEGEPPYASVSTAGRTGTGGGVVGFAKQPVGFFKGRKPLWWVWWLLRAGALVGTMIAFIVLLNNFYKYRTKCAWCKHLSCLPISNWCDLGNLHLTTTNTTSKRDSLSGLSLRAFL